MRLGLHLGYWTSARDLPGHLALVREAETLGYDSVWAAEAYGSDTATTLAWLAGQTERIGLGAGVFQIPGRSPASTAMTAASLDAISGGRFRLGLGVSGPQVSEGWHGVRFGRPLARTREYIEVVRTALARRTVTHDGEFYPLPLPDGPGKPLKLAVRPVRDRIPIYLAAVGPRNLELAGEIADGWLAVFLAPEHAAEHLGHIRSGAARVGRDLDGFDVVPTVPLVVGDDVSACADLVRGYAALYVGGMGSREQNFYNQLAVRMGYAEAAAEVQEHFLAGRYQAAYAAVPEEFIDATSLLGPPERIAERIRRYADAGVTTLSVTVHGEHLDARLDSLRTLVRSAENAGVLGG
ncbi:MAG: LLM class F420-dependent oxidoreductase [Micromonosporaceae bacterium]